MTVVASHPIPHASSRVRPASPETKDLIATLNASKRPTFGMPALFVTAEVAEVAEALSNLLRRHHGGADESYQTFFCNSRYEAVQGAIKLLRHRGRDGFISHGGRLIVLDPRDDLRAVLDPLDVGSERALAPGLSFVRDIDELSRAPELLRACCGVVVWGLAGAEAHRCVTALRRLGAEDVPVVLDMADVDPSSPGDCPLAELGPHLVVLGESLTQYEVPFGAFAGPRSMFRAWHSGATAFVHTTTYGGNTLAATKVKLTVGAGAGGPRRSPGTAAPPWETTLARYAEHVNAQVSRFHRLLGGVLDIRTAEGGHLTVRLASGRRLPLVDAMAGGGLGVSGHNPEDVRTELLALHSTDVDYGAAFEALAAAETGLPHAFPAVSGTGAVENALTLAMLARPERRRIVTFRGNYSGKTLLPLAASSTQEARDLFAPLYPDVCFIDPFGRTAYRELEAVLRDEQTALVWMELVHGSAESFAPIPEPLLGLIGELRDEAGYLIGVDEILTSYYRCGPRFAHRTKLPRIDVLTLSKTLSYLAFPVGYALASHEVVAQARARNATAVEAMKRRHAFQLGAHFACHAVEKVNATEVAAAAAAAGVVLQQALAGLRHSRSIGRYLVQGGFVRLELKAPWALRRWAAGRSLYEALLTVWWAARTKTFVLADCLGPPLSGGAASCDHVARAIERFGRTSPWRLLTSAIWFLLMDRARGWWVRAHRSLTGSGTADQTSTTNVAKGGAAHEAQDRQPV